jgi:potassium/hydrogen antiporter
VVWVGVAGTFVTAAALAVLAHVLIGMDWWVALLLGTALAPTDPAVVFSVLGRRGDRWSQRHHPGRRVRRQRPSRHRPDTSLLTTGQAAGLDAAGSVAGVFLLQLVVGAAVGVAGGVLLVGFMRRVPLPVRA